MKRHAYKIIFLTAVITLLWAALPFIKIRASQADSQTAPQNIIGAGILSVLIVQSAESPDLLMPFTQVTKSFDVVSNGTLKANYLLTASTTHTALCDALRISVFKNSEPVFEGSLFDFAHAKSSLTNQSDRWTIGLTLLADDQSLTNQACDFTLISNAWQQNIERYGDGGFTSSDEVPFSLTSGNWKQPEQGDIVINEVMWSGSAASVYDIWIELYNTTEYPFSLYNWRIENASGIAKELILEEKTIINPHDYFLIARFHETNPSSALAREPNITVKELALKNYGNGNLVLKTATNTVIDMVIGNAWPAGSQGMFYQSMERIQFAQNGLSFNSWQSCTDFDRCRLQSLWKETGESFGTPGGPNSDTLLEPPMLPPVSFTLFDEAEQIENELREYFEKNNASSTEQTVTQETASSTLLNLINENELSIPSEDPEIEQENSSTSDFTLIEEQDETSEFFIFEQKSSSTTQEETILKDNPPIIEEIVLTSPSAMETNPEEKEEVSAE